MYLGTLHFGTTVADRGTGISWPVLGIRGRRPIGPEPPAHSHEKPNRIARETEMNSSDEQSNYSSIHPGDDQPSRKSFSVLNSKPRRSKPRRSNLLPLVVFGLTGSLIVLAQKMGPTWVLSTPKQLQTLDQAPPAATIQNAVPVENMKTPESSKSLVLDAAQSYLASGALKVKK